jgi:ribosomal protein L32
MALALRAGFAYSQNPLIAALQNGLQTLFQSPASLLELLPPILLAVPKSRVSHSRKRMRSANKHLKEKDSESITQIKLGPVFAYPDHWNSLPFLPPDIVTCPGCGRAKASHNFCSHCYSAITRGFKTEAKKQQSASARQAGPSSSSTPSSEKSLADAAWARGRGGALPHQEGQPLTKWMKARLGYGKSVGGVELGQEAGVKSKDASRQDEDDHHDGPAGGDGMPTNLRFA